MTQFDVSEAIWICAYHDGEPQHICPDCIDHAFGKPSEYYDCKNVFIDNHKIVGQCMCYALEHGKRED